MPRSSRTGELIFDPEIEKTAKANRKAKRQEDSLQTLTLCSSGFESDEEVVFEEEEMEEQRTLRELATPDMNQQPLCIEFPNINVAFELKSGLIHLLPTFHGLVGEDPHKHLKEFHVVCSTMKP